MKLVGEGNVRVEVNLVYGIYESVTVQVHITVILHFLRIFLPVHSFADFFTLSQRFLLIRKNLLRTFKLVLNSQIVVEIVSLH